MILRFANESKNAKVITFSLKVGTVCWFEYGLISKVVSLDTKLILGFADELKNAKRLGKFKQYIVGRSSEATFADAFEKQETIMRYLGARDATGEVGFFLSFF